MVGLYELLRRFYVIFYYHSSMCVCSDANLSLTCVQVWALVVLSEGLRALASHVRGYGPLLVEGVWTLAWHKGCVCGR